MPTTLIAPTTDADPILATIDELVASTDPIRKPALSNALLELHSAWCHREDDPTRLIATFLQHRRRLAKHDYLLTHRFRRLLEKSFQARLATPERFRTLPLNLAWASLARLLNHLRNQHFEHSEDSWDDITLTIIPTHG
ncbi:MAG: hypothetical protein AAF357_19295 [Verrucomicrobiota bacterium]